MKTWTSVALLLILNGAASAQTVVWEASLTVENSGTYTGYDAAGGYGALSNTRFSHKGVRETVTRLRSWEYSPGNHLLYLGLPEFYNDGDARVKWTLHIGTETFTGTDAAVETTNPGWKWNGRPTWADGNTVRVKLTTTYPGPPDTFHATEIDPNGTGVRLRWTAPTSAGSEPISKYQYRHGGLAYGSWQEWQDIAGADNTETTVTMPYAWPDATYPFQMRAYSDEGDGLWSPVEQVAVVDERGGLQVSDTSAYEGYEDTPGGRERNIGDTNMLRFDVSIDPPAGAGNWIEVTLSTRDGTAVKGEDYGRGIYVPRDPPDANDYFGRWEGITQFRFEGSETSQSVYVQIYDDHVEDSGETMELKAHIHRVSGLDWQERPPPVKTTGVGTILNDEEIGQNSRASVTDVEAREADGEINFIITLSEPVSADVSVLYRTRDNSAVAGDDYTETRGWTDFLGGETTKTITVPLLDDNVDEEREDFDFQLRDFINLSGGSGGTGTIIDEDVTALTAELQNMPSSHEGEGEEFAFRVKFNQKVTTRYQVMENHVFTVTNGQVSAASRVDGRRDLWKITVEPDADDDVAITLPETTDCSATGAVCSQKSQGKPAQPLSRSVTATVTGPEPDPLTATFSNVPAEHDKSEFTFDLSFSENFKLSYVTLRDDDALLINGGEVRRAQRKTQGHNQHWTITIEPTDTGDVGITLPETTSCSATGAMCAEDGRKLSHSTSATVRGPIGISVADAEVEEGAGVVLGFTVALSRAASSSLTVDYATSDGTATAGADYTSASGTLTIGAGSSSAGIDIAVIDDEHNEGSETFTLTLSNASSGTLTDATATGTITNYDALPKALLARVGRSAAVHVVEQVEARVNAPRAPGFDGQVAGRQINRDMGKTFAVDLVRQLAGDRVVGRRMGLASPDLQPGSGMPASGLGSPSTMADRTMGGEQPSGGFGNGLGLGGREQLLGGSRFALNRETAGGSLAFWSRSATSSFAGQDGGLALGGNVRSTMFGADYARGRMITGVSLAHTRGLGTYAGVDSGQMTSAVTGLYPWIGFKASERVTVWTVAGYGAGGLMLQPGSGAPVETGLSMTMVAGGGRGEIVTNGEGFELAFKADTLWVGTRSEAVSGPGGNLDSTQAGVTRLRAALEGSQSMTFAGRMALTPSVEIGLRQDGGDAEVGRGLDVGAGLVLADGVTGLAVDVRIRRLLVHQAAGFAESGMAVSVSYDPTPETPLGLTARVSPSWGGDAMSGAEALWDQETMGGMSGRNDPLRAGAGGARLDTEIGYGLPIGQRFVGTPRVGVLTSEHGREYRVGYGVQILEEGQLRLQVGVEAERRVSPVFGFGHSVAGGGADQRVLGQASIEW